MNQNRICWRAEF